MRVRRRMTAIDELLERNGIRHTYDVIVTPNGEARVLPVSLQNDMSAYVFSRRGSLRMVVREIVRYAHQRTHLERVG